MNTVMNDSSDLKKELFPDLCRVCMTYTNNMKCVSGSEVNKAVKDLEFCTGVLINNEDGLPTKLCDSCLSSLAIAYKFKKSCLRSDELFRNALKKQNIIENEIKIEIDEVIKNADDYFEYQDVHTKHEPLDDDMFDIDEEINFEPPSITPMQTRLKNINKTKVKSEISKNTEINKIEGVREVEIEFTKNNKPTELDVNKSEASKKIRCTICDETFNSVEEQANHKEEQHNNCEWMCEICGKTFKHRSSHYTHFRSHQTPKHACDKCDYKTPHKADLKKHLSMHSGVKEFVCEYCTKAYHCSSNLTVHIRRHHAAGAGAGERRGNVCARCHRAFSSPDKLRRHMDAHDHIKRFECELCTITFARRCQWRDHLAKQHNVSVPKVRPGRRKINFIVGEKESDSDQQL